MKPVATVASAAHPSSPGIAEGQPQRRESGVYSSQGSEPPRAPAPQARTFQDRYRITGLIGQGGMASVHEAEDLLLGRVVAIKSLPQSRRDDIEARKRLWREAQIGSRFDHPNMCPVVDVGTLSDGSPFIAFPRLRGVPFTRYLRDRKALPVSQLLPLFVQLLRALHVVHREGVVHRDVKPENLFLTSSGAFSPTLRLLDFGAAFWERDGAPGRAADETIGTTACLAPEQVRGDADVDRRVDIYQAGLVLYECMTGAFPFACGNIAVLLRDIAEGRWIPVAARADVPEPIERVIQRALSRDRDDRFESAEAFETAVVTAAAESEDQLGGPHSSPTRVVVP